ncbi:MAG TPA: glutamyl-tRNA reductase [Streptosporangiaceae bacterium]|nr:glutamyl-tRNA reductase [Streptosporangiaceae bacterium]
MSVLVVGLSHKSASLGILERAVVSGDALGKLLRDVSQAPNVAGAFVVSTCNRAEVYAEVDKFHGGVSSITDLLAQHSGIPLSELTPHLYVHYEDRAVQHLLAVACGLDSMVVGESQILGQVRHALGAARAQRTLSRGLGEVGALALRAAKRAHTETRIDRAGANLVSVGIAAALDRLGLAPEQAPDGLAGRTVLVVGAGSMSSLAATTAARLGAAHIVVANRTADRAGKLAAVVAGSTADLADLAGALAGADLVISCTGATGVVISAELVASALRLRAATAAATGTSPSRPLVLLDLALPRDVDPAAGQLPGVHVVSLDALSEAGGSRAVTPDSDVAAVRAIVAEEFAGRVSAMHAARVAPTVVALRAKAATVVDAELARLEGRLRTADHGMLNEVERAMRRVVDKLLHAPTVRVKELAGSPGGDSYEDALRVLFDLDPAVVNAVTVAETPTVGPEVTAEDET